jgi:hypothetical protein
VAAIDIDRETAHEAAAGELAKPIYPKASLSDRIASWLNDLLNRIVDSGAALPGGWLTIVVLALLVLAVLIAAARIARRAMGGRGSDRLYGERLRSAADYRLRAEQAATQRDWAAAIRNRVRAISRQLEEDGVLNPVAGRTARELAIEAGAAIPDFADDLTAAATAFNDVTYGELPGTETNYRLVSDLDDRLRAHNVAAARPGPEAAR